MLAPRRGDDADHSSLTTGGLADRHPLDVEGGVGDPPPVADRADPLTVRNPDVGEKDLVELGLAGDLAQRPDFDAGVVHVAEEVGQAGVLDRLRVGARDQDRERARYALWTSIPSGR